MDLDARPTGCGRGYIARPAGDVRGAAAAHAGALVDLYRWGVPLIDGVCRYATRTHTVIADVASLRASSGEWSIDDALRDDLLYSDVQQTDDLEGSDRYLGHRALMADFDQTSDDRYVIVLHVMATATDGEVAAAAWRARTTASLRKRMPPGSGRQAAGAADTLASARGPLPRILSVVRRGGRTRESFIDAVVEADPAIGRLSGWFDGGPDDTSRVAFRDRPKARKTIDRRLREAERWLTPIGPAAYDVDAFLRAEAGRYLGRPRASRDDGLEEASMSPGADASKRTRDGEAGTGTGDDIPGSASFPGAHRPPPRQTRAMRGGAAAGRPRRRSSGEGSTTKPGRRSWRGRMLRIRRLS